MRVIHGKSELSRSKSNPPYPLVSVFPSDNLSVHICGETAPLGVTVTFHVWVDTPDKHGNRLRTLTLEPDEIKRLVIERSK